MGSFRAQVTRKIDPTLTAPSFITSNTCTLAAPHLLNTHIQSSGGYFQPVSKPITKHRIQTVKAIETVPQLQQFIWIQNKEFIFEVDMGADDNFCSTGMWRKAGEPTLSPVTGCYEVANGIQFTSHCST